MFWQLGSRSDTAAVAAFDGGAAVGLPVPAAVVGFVVALFPPHAVRPAATNASATIAHPCRRPPRDRVIRSSLPIAWLIALPPPSRPCAPVVRAPRRDRRRT